MSDIEQQSENKNNSTEQIITKTYLEELRELSTKFPNDGDFEFMTSTGMVKNWIDQVETFHKKEFYKCFAKSITSRIQFVTCAVLASIFSMFYAMFCIIFFSIFFVLMIIFGFLNVVYIITCYYFTTSNQTLYPCFNWCKRTFYKLAIYFFKFVLLIMWAMIMFVPNLLFLELLNYVGQLKIWLYFSTLRDDFVKYFDDDLFA
ncbi:MAG: hypothetical protein Satyrvirus16_6 [Satyrvirus sp.]|uniref:Transmembrane protein n=1 Tax=Satyrvirus sp. TaxID=2487771 RepID=A0A3G5AE27_9VIRU|nr:MAG: hypothetical protein Satyrvirus16_6 [Satyrvirus sp.]